MPLYRHACHSCGRETLELMAIDSPAPECACGSRTERKMPRRVVGRVVPDSNGVHVGSGFASYNETDTEVLASASGAIPCSMRPKPVDTEDPRNLPLVTKHAKDYAECDAAERDARWRDTTEAMAAYQARNLASDGMDYGDALRTASAQQQQISHEARSTLTTDA